MATGTSDKLKEKRNRVFLGQLPTDFLRLEASSQQQQEAADRQAALALHQQFAQPYMSNPVVGKLSITVAQAKLVKNYGMTRMDPYARIRVGHCVYETHTDPNGGKNPRWNKVLQHIILPQGVNSISVEIYDECSFTMDELIAWTVINIPKQVLAGETHEDWYPLNGKQGEGVEGMINLVLSYSTATQPYYPVAPPVMMLPNMGAPRMAAPLTVYSAPPPMVPPQIPMIPVLSEEELKQIEEMFPTIDKEVIKSVFEANRGNKDLTVNSLLQMCE